MPNETRGSVRYPWLVPIVIAVVTVGLFLAIVLTRGGLNRDLLLAHLVTDAAIFLALAGAAILTYRYLRRTGAPQAMDEASSTDPRS
jgi:high-affinity Fe2+/Pb2+ permease